MIRRKNEAILTAPTLLWLILFFVVPSIAMVVISFRPASMYGGVGEGWTLDAWRALGNPNYPVILWRTVWLSLVTTLICLALALPIAFVLGKMQGKWRAILLMIVIVPFWTNFVIRVAAWRILLHPEGMLRQGLISLGIIGPDTLLLYNEGAVLMVMVYSYLPFAILPLYAAAERFDYSLLEAARDLGASGFTAVTRVFIPGISRGLLTAMALVLIPALGSYVIPDLVGGPGDEMIGNKIAQRTLGDRNLPQAATLSVALLVITLIPMIVVYYLNRRERTHPA
jgi:ABC-type spermidine/putrescine transport system permease subunit I